jgi:type IV pilus assembly protein PilZ
MSDSNPSSEAPVGSDRVPLEREVVLEFEHFSSFIKEYSANISVGGMFVKTDDPRLPGTFFRFEIRLADDAPLVAGLAKVLWTREGAQAPDRPAGMGVRFIQLEDEGRSLIEQIVREHLGRGGQPFSLEEAGEDVVDVHEAEQTEPEPEPAAELAADAAGSAVSELPPLEELLEEARTPTATLTLETPPRGWKPGISVARPRTRPQLIGTIAVAAIIVTAVLFFFVRRAGRPPVLAADEVEPVALPQVEEQADAAAEPPPPPFTGVEEITWQRSGSGAEIVVRLDGSLPEGSWSIDRMVDPPRQVLRLTGASRPYPTETFEVGFGGVRQLRTGYFDATSGNHQEIVVDLVDPRVVLEDSRVDGQLVRLRFRR